MNPGYPRVYAPVLRSPLLFHNHSGLYYAAYHRQQLRVAPLTTNSYLLQPTCNNNNRAQFQSQPQSRSRYTAQAPLPYSPRSYPYYSAVPRTINPSLVPLPSYYFPSVTYASTVSSRGLTLILIATLMLVALDLVIVRPQKR